MLDSTGEEVAEQAKRMREALRQAELARERGEVPVGAVLYDSWGNLLGAGGNQTITDLDPSGHAEIVCLRKAASVAGNYRLSDCRMYVTVEPCAMCAGAIIHARLGLLCYGASDPKTGACGSVTDLFANTTLNHHTRVVGNVLGEECGRVLSDFFRNRR